METPHAFTGTFDSLMGYLPFPLAPPGGQASLRTVGDNSCDNRFVVVDVGSRYGLHPTWKPAQEIMCFELYEPDASESKRLQHKYADYPNIRVHQKALGSVSGVADLIHRRHRGLSSFYEIEAPVPEISGFHNSFDAATTEQVEVAVLDELFPSGRVHFLKVDAEGSELEILMGAEALLQTTVQGVRAEVSFTPIYKGAGTFGDIHNCLSAHGFVLLNLDYNGRGTPQSFLASGEKYGRLLTTDAVWIVPANEIANRTSGSTTSALLHQALFLLLNGASDVALKTLQYMAKLDDRWLSEPSPTHELVRRYLANEFRVCLSSPSADATTLHKAWQDLFHAPFPSGHLFWEEFG